MLNRYLYIFVAASAMLLAGCFANYHHAELGPNDVVLALGDQFTSGGNVSESFRYTTVLGQNTNARIVNLGRSGAMVADAIPVLRENLAKHPNTRLVIVSLGYNDIIKGVDPRFVMSAFVELFREAQKAKVPVLLVGIPKLPYTKGNDKPTALFEELGANNHIIYEREAFAAVLREAENMESGNQFNADGYRVFAEELEARLRKEGFIRG